MQVLIIKLSSLGDVVHSMPAVQDIRTAIAHARIDWVVEPSYASLVRRVEGIGDVIELPLRRWAAAWWSQTTRREFKALRARLTRQRYDATLDLQGLTKSALVGRVVRLSTNGHRYGIANRTEGSSWEFAARCLVDRPIHIAPRTHAMDRSRVLAGRALGYNPEGPPRYGLRATPPARNSPSVVFVHGSSRDDKLWPLERWIALGQRLTADGMRIGLPQGDAGERERAQRLASALGPQAEVWPEMSIDAVVDRMAASQGVIGVDSGLSHIAVALGLPHVQLYNFPTAWRTGPQKAHGHLHQVSVLGQPSPALQEVWSAWCSVKGRGFS
ncbi:MAG: lipopolysaccharide heptosyltransferase I [Burkholderiaceae bacterium]|nr:lipopolysaccharide heptosyltransferase I [Burkholderiaceae bacterium]MDH3459483.1 lipopolysaccharide heptosyltransferase I [Burkholderiaceae bacterium]